MTTTGPSPPLEILGTKYCCSVYCSINLSVPYNWFMSSEVREPDGFSLWNGPPFSNGQPSVKLERSPCTSARFSEDGSKLMVMKSESVISIYDCSNYKEIRSFEVPSVLAAILSPCGTYLQTFQKSMTPQEKNVVLWRIETGDSVYQLFQKNMAKTTWYILSFGFFLDSVILGSQLMIFVLFRPSIRFSSDEAVACRLATNEIQFFDAVDFSKGIINRLRIPGVAAFELSKTPGSHVAAFVPESKVCTPLLTD